MTDLRTAAQQALEYMKFIGKMDMHPEKWAIINRLEAALAEPVQEPVQLEGHCLWARNGNEPCPHVQQAKQTQEPVATKNENGITLHSQWDSIAPGNKLYTSPPQRKPLTKEEIHALRLSIPATTPFLDAVVLYTRAVEAAHGIK